MNTIRLLFSLCLFFLVASCATTGVENTSALDGTWVGRYTYSTDSVEAILVISGSSFTLTTDIADKDNCKFINREYTGVVWYDSDTISFSPEYFTEFGNPLDVRIILANRAYRFYPFARVGVGTTFYSRNGDTLELNFIRDKKAPIYYPEGSHTFSRTASTGIVGERSPSVIEHPVF